MSGEELRKRLIDGGYTVNSIAKMLGKKSQDISQILNKTADIKTGFLEDLCRVLKVDMSFFYGGSEFLSMTLGSSNTDTNQMLRNLYDDLLKNSVTKSLYEDVQKKLIESVEEIGQLKNQISLMQKGMTIPEIAKKEVV